MSVLLSKYTSLSGEPITIIIQTKEHICNINVLSYLSSNIYYYYVVNLYNCFQYTLLQQITRHIDVFNGLHEGYGVGQMNMERRMLSEFCLE